MADEKPDKALEEAQKKEQEESKKEVISVCTLNLRQILVALHEKALSEVDGKFKSGDIDITIQNSAIEGAGGKDAKFYGAGQHIIAAIPKDNKGLDKNKIEKKDAVKPLQTYVQWFVGPDLKDKVVENILKPLEDGAEGKVADNHEKKEDIEKSKSDSVAGEKYKESTIFVPSFSQYLLTEEGEDISSDEDKEKDKKEDDKSVKGKNAKDSKGVEGDPGKGPNQAQGWYVEYKLTIPGQKEHPITDALKGFAKDLLKAVGIKFTSLFGGADGKVHTIGDFTDAWDSVFGKMDATEFEAKFNEELKKRMKNTEASAKIWDTPTVLKYLKQEVSKYKSKIQPVKFALCVKVNKNDKSYKLFNEDAIANIANASIPGPMRGIVQKMKFKVSGKDVILVNNYKDNKKAKDNEKFDTDKAEGAVADSLITKVNKQIITEQKDKIHVDILESILNNYFDFDNIIKINGNNIDKVNNLLLESMFAEIDESLLLEGHSKEFAKCKELLKKVPEFTDDYIDKLEKEYKTQLSAVKKNPPDYSKSENKKEFDRYLKRMPTDDDNWLFKDIGKYRNLKPEDVIKPYNDGKMPGMKDTDGLKFEYYAFQKALEKVAPPEKKEDEDSDKITITFRDVDDPGELSDPESPSDEDKEKYKTIGDPLELVPGEDVKIPEIKNKGEKGEWEFMGFEPDPENMDESGYTYAIYTKNGPDTVKITFYDADPETGDKTKEALGDPVEVEIGKPANSSPEALKAFEEYNGKLEKEKKDGYVFKGWNPDPKTKIEENTDFIAKYIEEDEKDTKYTVMFQYAPDQEKPNDLDVIQVNKEDDQKVAAGEKAERPDIENMKEFKDLEEKGYIFKDWGDAEKNLDNVQDDIVAVAQFTKLITITPKVPKDPEKPDKDLEPFGDPIKYDPKKPLEKELPDPPEKKGWKPTGKWSPDPKDIKDPKEDIDIIPEYKKDDGEKKNEIKLIFRAPKDPEKPDDTEIIGKKPIKYDPDLSIEDLAPQPPEFKGWHFKDWNPKLSEIKDPKDNTEIKAEYDKGIVVKFKIQDPKFVKKSEQNLADAFEEINVDKNKLDTIKIPNHKDVKDIPNGYSTYGKTTWLLPPYTEDQKNFSSDNELKDKIKKYFLDNKDKSELIVILRLSPTKNFIIKVVDVDPEKPEDESKETDIASINVFFDINSDKNVYKPEDLTKISDRIHGIKFPDEKLANKIDGYIEHNKEALKIIEQKKTSSKGDFKLDPEKLLYAIQAKSENPGDLAKMQKDKDGNKFVKVKTSYGKEQFKVKIVNPDPEDPENTKSQEPIATITVFMQGDEKFYKSEDLAKLAKDTKSKDEADKYNKAAKDNEAAFKSVENIAKLSEKNKPYKFLGWTGPNTKDNETEELQNIIDNGPADGENEIVVKAKYNNDIKAKHTELDFYIIPMKGLKDKEKKSESK